MIEEMAHVICESRMANFADGCRVCSYHESCLYQDIACALYRDGYRKQSKWISVEERLPHWSDGKVLVFTQYGFSICERTVNGRWKGQHANWITHWMPLPEAPKMKGGEE